MTTATVGDRFQVVIPRKERERIGLKPRMKVQWDVLPVHCGPNTNAHFPIGCKSSLPSKQPALRLSPTTKPFSQSKK